MQITSCYQTSAFMHLNGHTYTHTHIPTYSTIYICALTKNHKPKQALTKNTVIISYVERAYVPFCTFEVVVLGKYACPCGMCKYASMTCGKYTCPCPWHISMHYSCNKHERWCTSLWNTCWKEMSLWIVRTKKMLSYHILHYRFRCGNILWGLELISYYVIP